MMIAQGPQAGLPPTSPVAPAAAPNSDAPTPASAQGFLAALGAAIQQAVAPTAVPVPVVASVDTAAKPPVPEVEIPGPGDTEQADGWRGPSTQEEALSQAQQLSRPIIAAPTAWNDLVSGKATRPGLATSATVPAKVIATGVAPKAAAQVTPLPSPRVTVSSTAAVPQADGSDGVPTPELSALAADTRADVRPTQAVTRVTPLKKELKPVAAVAPSVAQLAEPKTETAPDTVDPAVAIAAAPVIDAAEPNVELARAAAQSLSATAQLPVQTSGKAPVAPRPGSPVRPMPVAVDAVPSIDPKSAAAECARRTAPAAGSATRSPIGTEPEASTGPVATDIRAEPVKQPLPPEIMVRVTESAGNPKADARPTPVPAPVVATVPLVNPVQPTPTDSVDDSDSSTSRVPLTATRTGKARGPASPLAEPALPTPVPHSTLAGAQTRAAEPVSAPTPEAPLSATAKTQAEPSLQPRGTERVTLQLPHDDGGVTRVRIAVRGDQVRTTLISSDASTSAQLSSQAPELERALAARGFRDAEVAVPQAAGVAPLRETGSGAALGIASAESGSGERLQGNNRHADGSAGESRQGTAERDRESPDQRAEDQPRQGRSHQRARRERAR
jgi:hypothetical protein